MKNGWIWLDKEKQADSYVEFIDKFNYEQGQATIKISCDSNYALYVNGEFVGFSQFSDYPWHKFYNSHLLNNYLKKGENDIKIIVWYYGEHNFSYYVGEPCLNYEISIDEQLVCSSSEKTLCRKAVGYEWGRKKEITGQLGFTFKYDCGDKGGEFAPAVKVNAPCEKVYPRPIENLVLGCDKLAKKIDSNFDVYDLGEESVGLLYIDFKAEKGVTLTVSYGEHLRGGRVPRIIHTRDFSAEMVASGKREKYLNPFRRFGARYLEITADGDYEIYAIGLKETYYPFNEKPFETDSESAKKIYDVSKKTLTLCFHEHYEDCPWREQGLYGLDSRHQMLFGYYAFNGFECQRSSLELFCLHFREDGLLPICSPTSHPQPPIPSFTLFFIVAMGEYVKYTGDTTLISQYYEKLESVINGFVGKIKDGLFRLTLDGSVWNFYEWRERLSGDDGAMHSTDSMINCTLSLALQSMASMCESLGKADKAEEYRKISKELNDAVYENFYDQEKKAVNVFDYGFVAESACALAILCGAVNGVQAQAVADTLAKGEVDCVSTLSMKAFKYDALIKVDKEKYAQVILSEIDKNYNKMLDCGATSFWETELGSEDFDGAGSLCHGWSAMPVYYYNVLGLNKAK